MKNSQSVDINKEAIISAEVKRLSEEFGKAFLDCDDIAKLTGLGMDNARMLMNSYLFPITKVGKRQVVSILAFVAWQMTQIK